MLNTAPGIVVTPRETTQPFVLLVKTSVGWGIPIGQEGETFPTLLSRIATELLVPGNTLQLSSNRHKTISAENAELNVELAVCDRAELRPFLESNEWYDARFSSFEEASYIMHASQSKLLHWCERVVPKALAA